MRLNKVLYVLVSFMIFSLINSCVSPSKVSTRSTRSNKTMISKAGTKIESNSVNGIAIDSENFDQYKNKDSESNQNLVENSSSSDTDMISTDSNIDNAEEVADTTVTSSSEEDVVSDSNISDRLSSFLLRQLSSTKIEKITDEDRSLLESLTKDKYNVSGSIEEASMAIFIINTVLTSTDLETTDSLYDMCVKYDFSMLSALSKNPFLKTYKVYDLVLTANQKIEGKNQGTFTARLEKVVNKQVDLWSTLKQYGSSVADTGSSSNLPNVGTQISSDSLESGLDIDLSNASKSEEHIFKEAQNLADSYKYKEAITVLEKIEESSDFYKVAQQKMSEYSYLAVQDLRRKAAIAFQNSIPVADTSIKKMYLQEAKRYLEVALTDFPHISQEQLSTVKENLVVITEDLDKNSEVEE